MALAGWVTPDTHWTIPWERACTFLPHLYISLYFWCFVFSIPIFHLSSLEIIDSSAVFSLCSSKAFRCVSNGFCLFLIGKPIWRMAKAFLKMYIRRRQIYSDPCLEYSPRLQGFLGPEMLSLGLMVLCIFFPPLVCQLLPETMWTSSAHNILCQGVPRSYLLCEVLPPFGYFGS